MSHELRGDGAPRATGPEEFHDLATGRLSREFKAYATVELTDRAIVARDLRSFVRMWNPAAAALYGYTEDEALGRLSHDLLATRFPRPLQEIDHELFGSGAWEGPLLHLTKAGEPLLVVSRWVLQRTPDGEPNAILEFNREAEPREAGWWLAPGSNESLDLIYLYEPVRDVAGAVVDLRLRFVNDEVRIVQGERPRIGMPTADWDPGFRSTLLFRHCLEVLDTARAREFRDVRLQPPWAREAYVVDGCVVPFGELVAIRARDVTEERRALQALDDAQARVRLALAAAPVEVAQTDRDLVVTWTSPSMPPELAEHLIGRPIVFGADPEDGERFRAAAGRVLAGGREERLEADVSAPGAPAVIDFVIHPQRQGDDIVGLIVAGMDVTESRRLQRELQRERTLVAALLDNAPDAVALMDLEGRWLLANAAAAAATGHSVDEVIGRTNFDLLEHGLAAEQREKERAVIASGRPSEETVRAMTADGPRAIWVRRFPVFDEGGALIALGGFATDITEEEEATAEREVSALAMQLADVAMCVVRKSDMTLLDVNDRWCEERELRREDVVGKPATEIRAQLGVAQDPSVAGMLERLREGGGGRFRVQTARRAGVRHWVEAHVAGHEHAEHGTVWVIVSRDIDDVVAAERELAAAKAKLAEHGLG